MGSKDHFFFDKERFRTIDTYRLIYFVFFLTSLGLTELGRYVYRPYIYENDLNDFGIADSMGNLGGIMVQIFFALTILNSNRVKGIRIMGLLVVGYILYEIIQPILPKGVFDWLDIYGTIIGGTVALFLFLLVHRIMNRNRIYFKVE